MLIRMINTTILVVCCVMSVAIAQTDMTFTYQGQLEHNESPLSGQADFSFYLWSVPEGNPGSGAYISGPMTLELNNGLFTAKLNFGDGIYTDEEKWLEVRVRYPSGTGQWTTLSPRQQVTATPYAILAHRAKDLQFPLNSTSNENEHAMVLVHTGDVGSAARFSTTNATDDPTLYVQQGGNGRGGHFAISNVSNASDAVWGFTAGGGSGVSGLSWGSGPAVEGRSDGTGQAGNFYTSLSNNNAATLYAQQEGTGRCGHFRITNTSNSLEAVAGSTTGPGVAISGYTVGSGYAGKFEINNASSDSAAVKVKTNGTGFGVSAEAKTRAVWGASTVSSNTGSLGGSSFGVHAQGDLVVDGGAFRGDIDSTSGSDGAPFPRPAYDSGWMDLGIDGNITLTHNIGGDRDDYVLDIQRRNGFGIHIFGIGLDTDGNDSTGVFYSKLTSTTVYVGSSSGEVRLRIWVIR